MAGVSHGTLRTCKNIDVHVEGFNTRGKGSTESPCQIVANIVF